MRVSWIILISVINLVIHVRATCDHDPMTCSSDSEKRHCQFDGETQVEFCATPILCEAGQHAVLHNDNESVSCEECAEDTFQQRWKWSNNFTQPNCDELITECEEEEQLVCENGTKKQDYKCKCNQEAGYKLKQDSDCNPCFSHDKICECEFQSPESTSFPSSLSVSTTTTATTNSPSNDDTVLIIALLILFVVIIVVAVVVCLYCRRKHLCIFKKKSKKVRNQADGLLQNERVEGSTGDIEAGSVDGQGTENDQGGQIAGDVHETTGLTGNSRAENVYAAHNVDGGIGHGFVFNCCNCMGDATGRQSSSNSRSQEHKDRTLKVTGVSGQATVHTANVAGIVEGGIGHRNNSGMGDATGRQSSSNSRSQEHKALSEDTNV